jgi:hypothetical protein
MHAGRVFCFIIFFSSHLRHGDGDQIHATLLFRAPLVGLIFQLRLWLMQKFAKHLFFKWLHQFQNELEGMSQKKWLTRL